MQDFGFQGGVSLVLILVGFWLMFSNLRKARIIEDTPTSKIRSASQGYVELSGFAKFLAPHILVAPLTGAQCLWFSYKVERYSSSGKSSRWSTIESKTSDACFVLNDSTGDVVVYPKGAEINSRRRDCWRGLSRIASPPKKSTSQLLMNSGNYRFTEQRIHDGDYLYGLGMFQTFHAPPAHVQQADQMGLILSQWKSDYQALVERFDSNHDGELDMDEWQQARAAAALEASQFVAKNYDDTPVNTLNKPPQALPYILASKDPQQLTTKYRWQAAGAGLILVFGFVLGLHVLTELGWLVSA